MVSKLESATYTSAYSGWTALLPQVDSNTIVLILNSVSKLKMAIPPSPRLRNAYTPSTEPSGAPKDLAISPFADPIVTICPCVPDCRGSKWRSLGNVKICKNDNGKT